MQSGGAGTQAAFAPFQQSWPQDSIWGDRNTTHAADNAAGAEADIWKDAWPPALPIIPNDKSNTPSNWNTPSFPDVPHDKLNTNSDGNSKPTHGVQFAENNLVDLEKP